MRHGPNRKRLLKPRIEFQPRAVWIGIYVDKQQQALPAILTTMQKVYVCLIPMIAIVFTLKREYL